MTKSEFRMKLLEGHPLTALVMLGPGQDCTIFKADKFSTDDEVIYIPDIELNDIPVNIDLSKDNSMSDSSNGAWPVMQGWEQVKVVLSCCYTGADFVELCEGDEALAYRLFCYCDWQHPSSAFPEVDYDDEEDKAWVKQAYETAKKEGRVYVKTQ